VLLSTSLFGYVVKKEEEKKSGVAANLPKNVQKLLTNGNQFFEFMVILGEQYIGEMYLAFRKLNSKEIASPEDKAIYVQQKSTQYEALVKNYRAGLNLPELKSDVLIAITMGLACVIAPLAVESHDKYEEAVKKEKLAANRKAVRTDLQEMLNESKLLNDLKTDETIWLDLGYHCGNYKRIDDLPIPEVKQEKKKKKKKQQNYWKIRFLTTKLKLAKICAFREFQPALVS